MRLKRLELHGFKSFVDRTILTFEPGITGVVGPNGCGKSNIVDAIQWVMGEQSAKHLRGESMTDVIFNGSESRPPQSMAEVSLVLDKEGTPLSASLAAFEKDDEVSITRRVYRDGTGEYLINKTICRLKDIHELFMDTGVGKRAYSIIEQGQIDRMINVKPEDRRLIFEEVAGITKYKAKRREAEKKLEATHANLLRLEDIIVELEKQIRSLKIQATRARKYKEIKSELEVVDLHLLGRDLYFHQTALTEGEANKNELVELRSELDAKQGTLEAEATELEIKRLDFEKSYEQLSNRERDLSLLVQKWESELSLLSERKKHLSQLVSEANDEIDRLATSLDRLATQRESVSDENQRLMQSSDEIESAIRTHDSRILSQQETRLAASHKREGLVEKRLELSRKVTSNQNRKGHLEERIKEHEGRQLELNKTLTDLIVLVEAQKEKLVGADQKIAEISQLAGETETKVHSLSAECEALSHKLTATDEALFQLKDTYQAKQSRLDSLCELQKNLEGYSPSAREILLKLEGWGNESVPFAELFQPDAEFEESVELLLGDDINTLVVKNNAVAEELAQLVRNRAIEKVRILSLDDPPKEHGTPEPIPFESLCSRLKIKPGDESLVQNVFNHVFLCSTETELFQARKSYPHATFLTHDGKIIGHSDRSLTSGTLPRKTGVFGRRREIEELEEICRNLQLELNSHATERENLFRELQLQERVHEEVKDQLSSIHIQRVETRKEREQTHNDLMRLDRDYNQALEQSERNIHQMERLRQEIEDLSQELDRVNVQEADAVNEIATLDELITASHADFNLLVQHLNDKKIERTRLAEQRHTLTYKLERIEAETEEARARKTTLEEQKDFDEAEIEKTENAESLNRAEFSNSKETLAEVQIHRSDTKQSFDETTQLLQIAREKLSVLGQEREQTFEKLQETELKLASDRSTVDQLVALSEERYQRAPTALGADTQADISVLPLLQADLESAWDSFSEPDRLVLLREHLKNLKEKVSRYGEVNLTAIHEFDEIQKRYDFLGEQKQDLDRSIGILKNAIEKIETTTKARFTETFEAVNHKFKDIFPILFNGGKAELTLVFPEDGSDPGVDIMAQPPGKRLQSITLLSGGEKALTAVSLVLAIFARKPSPFCLLDEVDAPLDDANVSRFNTVVRKMAEKTQFVVITHNKKTMEIAESLYGVTMEKPGISKMTSVRLHA